MELKRFKAGGMWWWEWGAELPAFDVRPGNNVGWVGAEKTKAAAGPRRDATAPRELAMGVPLLFLSGKTRKTPAAPLQLGPNQPSPKHKRNT